VTDWFKGLFGRGEETDEAGANGSDREARFAAPPEAGSMMRNLLEFVDLRVEDVMVPRAEIVAVDEDASVHELLRRFMEANHSRCRSIARPSTIRSAWCTSRTFCAGSPNAPECPRKCESRKAEKQPEREKR
jgi:hypothetical protein